MKNKSYIGISFIILIFGIIFIPKILERIKTGTITKQDRLAIPENAVSEDNLYIVGPVPKFELTNQDNIKISNNDYLGKVYVLEFFFSTCPTICPKMNEAMVDIQNTFKDEKDFGIVSITINPEYDTAKVLKEHATIIGVTSPNWNMLTGDKEYIMSLSNKGFNLYAGQNSKVSGGFEHSGLFALIDKKGNIRCRKDEYGNPTVYYDGLKPEGVKQIKEDIKVLVKE